MPWRNYLPQRTHRLILHTSEVDLTILQCPLRQTQPGCMVLLLRVYRLDQMNRQHCGSIVINPLLIRIYSLYRLFMEMAISLTEYSPSLEQFLKFLFFSLYYFTRFLCAICGCWRAMSRSVKEDFNGPCVKIQLASAKSHRLPPIQRSRFCRTMARTETERELCSCSPFSARP